VHMSAGSRLRLRLDSGQHASMLRARQSKHSEKKLVDRAQLHTAAAAIG